MTDKLSIKTESTHYKELTVNKHYVQIFTLSDVSLQQWNSAFFELNREPTPKELIETREEIEDHRRRAVFLKLLHLDADSMMWFDYATESTTVITFTGDTVATAGKPQ